MDYTYLEKLVLLSLKELRLSLVTHGHKKDAHPIQKLWHVIGNSYYPNTVTTMQGSEMVKEEILDKADCTADDLRAALQMLLAEELIAFRLNHYSLTALGLRACREFRLNEV